ncbi:MAG: hypothetical protein KH230_26015 [Enterocloster asparagiformis]|nr:hypothetical protein [Enterocloster asparagiformis]
MGLLDKIFKKEDTPTLQTIKHNTNEAEKSENINKTRNITKADMQNFFITQYEMTDIIFDNNMAIMLINKNNQKQVLRDLTTFNNKIPLAIKLADIKTPFLIPLNEIEFESVQKKSGKDSYTQYYTFFECTPYSKTGKNTKYPLTLHYATKNLDSIDSETNFLGDIHYMQDGTIGKAKLINWIKRKCYVLEYGMVGGTLALKSVTTTDNKGNKTILYKL